MNVLQQLVEIRGFVESVNDLKDDLAFGLHTLQGGDIEKADDNSGIAGGVRAGFGVEPAPGAFGSAQATSDVDAGFKLRAQTAEDRAKEV